MKKILTTILALLAITTAVGADPTIGVVNFQQCVMESKFGQAERDSLMALQGQLSSQVQQTEEQLTGLVEKLRDPEYLDSLSPDAEQDLQMRYQKLQQELGQKQQQFYQIMNQGEMKVMETLGAHVGRASQIISKENGLELVIRQDICFFFTPTFEVTKEVIAEMDKLYAVEVGEEKAPDAVEVGKEKGPA